MIARIVQMHLVQGQDTGLFVAGVVPKLIVMEDLPQVHQSAVPFLCEVPHNLGIGVEVSVLLVGKIRFFSDHGGRAEDHADMSVQ